MEENRQNIWKLIFVIAVFLTIAGLIGVCIYLYNVYTGGNEYEDFKNKVRVSSSATEQIYTGNPSNEDTPDAPLDNVAPDIVRDTVNGGINFTELWKINPDLYAWIKIPNTMVDYPVAQYSGDDDEYYLHHNMYKESAFAGCIYTEKENKKDFSDPNTVLYGHNMQNGSMFRGLHSFQDKSFFDANDKIYIYLSQRTLTYKIFSAYEYDDRHLLKSFDFSNKEEFKNYLEYAQNPTASLTFNKRDVDITTDDKIITLSTCLGNSGSSRYLVQGVLIKDEPAE